MPEVSSSRVGFMTGLASVAGVVLVSLAGLGEWPAFFACWLAQPWLALTMSWKLGTRRFPQAPGMLRRETTALSILWLSGAGISALVVSVVSWLMAKKEISGSLIHAMSLSFCIGALLIGLWRIWPFWQTVERESTPWRVAWSRLPKQETGVWRGLLAAILVAVTIAGVLLLAWPALLAGTLRWLVAITYALALPGLHWGLQRIRPAHEATHVFDFLAAPRGMSPVFDKENEIDLGEAEPQEDAEGQDADLNRQLYEAARNGRVDQALQLLEAGADARALPLPGSRDQRSLVVLASVLPDVRLLRALIEHGVELNDASSRMTPLLAATRDSWHGRPDAVMMLLANGADPRVADVDGNTPLHHAARSTDPGVAALLRDAAAEVNVLNNERFSPLGIACAAGNWRLAKFLLERGALPEPPGGQSALLAAAATEEDDPVGVQLLLRHKAKVDVVDRRGRSALHEAVQLGHVEITSALLEAGASPNARDAVGDTPWLTAARTGAIGVLECLLPYAPDVLAVDGKGRNALMQACLGDSVTPELIRCLFELGVDPGQPDRSGKRAVELAAEAGHWAIVAMLDPQYPLPAVVADVAMAPLSSDARPPLVLLREGLQTGRFDGLEALLPLCPVDGLSKFLSDPQFSLQPSVIEWLLQHGADPEERDGHGNTLVFQLLGRGAVAVPALRTLLWHGVSPAGAGGLSRFLAACAHHGQDIQEIEPFALELLERGADPFAPSSAGEPSLSLAVRLSWLRLQNRLLDSGFNPEARDEQSMTALHLATVLGREEALKSLIVHGAMPEARTTDGQTPLGVALALGRRDLADWLSWPQWPLPKRALSAADIPDAAKSGDLNAVRRLLGLGFPVDAVDAQGCTALLRASGGGHVDIVNLLLRCGADPQQPANSGATPLSAAVSKHQIGIVDALLSAGADVEHRLPGGVTVLMLAAALGMPDVISRLIATGANVHVGDAQDLTPLHCAAIYGFASRDRPRLLALLDTLLLAGAEPDHVSADGVTPLLLLLGSRAELDSQCDENVVLAGVERLLEEGVSLEKQDSRGFSPLHLAALFGLSEVVRYLLQAGANSQLRDELYRTPREIALMRGFVDVAGEFASPIQSMSMARFLREPNG
ncbi:MAG: ankyrin repeat domain-containing protein [Xanthomonadaceae bacterium]|jgi:ankyrin repeat protein|nr:ankyrin repeat domain-containing protein [Xanthomonadaceae bacterium]